MITVSELIVQKTDTKAWRSGTMTGNKHYRHKDSTDSLYALMEAVGGRQRMIEQVRQLEQEGLITVKYGSVNTEIEEITISMEQVDGLYEYLHLPNKKEQIAQEKQRVRQWIEGTNCSWLKRYGQSLYDKLEKGTLDPNVQDANIWKLLETIAALKEDIWMRKLSSEVLGDSKLFQTQYADKIVTILAAFSPKVDAAMREDYRDDAKETDSGIRSRILAEHGIITYSQTLQLKGGFLYDAGAGTVDTALQPYGTVLNAQTLQHARLVSLKQITRIVTIENQANYEDAQYKPDTLYIYTHGFLSPKERSFLLQIAALAGEEVTFEHWSDMDYGGIRIFLFMKRKVFPRVKPLYMDEAMYMSLYTAGVKGTLLDPAKRNRLEQLDAEELEGLKHCILDKGCEYEQEELIGRVQF